MELSGAGSALPRKRIGAGLLITDEAAAVLLVKPTYKAGWEVPGGMVEAGEAPREAAIRECEEELGVVPVLGDLLCVHYVADRPELGDGLMFIFDAGLGLPVASYSLPAAELAAAAYVPIDELETWVTLSMARRLRAAAAARIQGVTAYLER